MKNNELRDRWENGDPFVQRYTVTRDCGKVTYIYRELKQNKFREKYTGSYTKLKMNPEECIEYYSVLYPDEVWKFNYKYKVAVSDLGKVGSTSKKMGLHKLSIQNNGYLSFRETTLHKLVWITFNGEVPDGLEILHINPDKTDCRLCNLRIGTHQENIDERDLFGNSLNKPVVAYKQGEELIFNSVSLAADYILDSGLALTDNKDNVYHYLCNASSKNISAYTYKWRYL